MTGQIESPTEDRRHTTKVRFGAISSEVFCKSNDRRIELDLPMIPTVDEMSEAVIPSKPLKRGKKK
jgi:hypothetical protein